MPTMTTLKPHRYASRSLVPGDEFEASGRDARILAALGRARLVEPPSAPAGEPTQPADAEQRSEDAPPAEPPADEAPKPKRKYKRRDMTAE